MTNDNPDESGQMTRERQNPKVKGIPMKTPDVLFPKCPDVKPGLRSFGTGGTKKHRGLVRKVIHNRN